MESAAGWLAGEESLESWRRFSAPSTIPFLRLLYLPSVYATVQLLLDYGITLLNSRSRVLPQVQTANQLLLSTPAWLDLRYSRQSGSSTE